MTRAGGRPFPLVPRAHFVGVGFGQHRSPRRGEGDEVAGSRPFRPGDRRTLIDWRASARLSTARGTDEFVVREFFADTAPRVAVVVDRRPQMELYAPPLPWLDKRATVDVAVDAIIAATVAAGGDIAYVAEHGGRPSWLRPGPPAQLHQRMARDANARSAAVSNAWLEDSLELLVKHAVSLPPGSFVFVLSDFAAAATSLALARLRALRLDVTPIIVQDPTWEQSFPAVGGVLLPIRDPATGAVAEVVVSSREARERATANERRLADVLAGFANLGFDPLVLGSAEPTAIAAAFEHWAERRKRLRRRSA